MPKKVWIVEGVGDDNPRRYQLKANETIGELKRHFANKLGISNNEVEISTETKRLTNESCKVTDVVDDGETLHVIPRAKAGE